MAEPARRSGLRDFLAAVLLVLAAAGACTPAPQDFGFAIESIQARSAGDGVELTVRQAVKLSREAQEALVHGVPLVVRVELSLRLPGQRSDVWRGERRFEIRYLPLSDHYQLAAGEGAPRRTYPRLRHLLAELTRVRLALPPAAIVGAEAEVRARTFLEKRELPPPMRLPTLFSSRWRHDSGWQSQVLSLPERA